MIVLVGAAFLLFWFALKAVAHKKDKTQEDKNGN